MEDYRKNLVKTIQETPKEQRGTVLDEAQNTQKYKNEKELNEFRKKLNKTPQEQKENTTNESYPEIKLSVEDWHSDEKVKEGMIKNHNRKRAFEILHNELIKDYGFEVEDISNKISPKIKNILEKNKNTNEEIEELQNFLNEVTGGKYFDQRYANHVFDAHYRSDVFSPENKKEDSSVKLKSKVLEDVKLNRFRQASGSDFFVAFGKSAWVREDNKNNELALFSSDNPKYEKFLSHMLMREIWNSLSNEVQQKINTGNEVPKEELIKMAFQKEYIQKDLREMERKDENGNLYYEVHGNNTKSRELLPLLMLEKFPIKIKDNDTTGGMYFEHGLSGLEWLAKKLNVHSLKWIDIADTIVNLKEGKIYHIKQSNKETHSIADLKENPLEQKKELEAMPIFRENDLYTEIFPEIEATFKKDDELTSKKIFEVLKKYQNKKVILDNTCFKTLKSKKTTTLEDFPQEFELKEIPEMEGEISMRKVSELLKQYFSIDLEPFDDKTIDRKIEKLLGGNFSSELVKGLLEMAKSKNNDIKEVYILSNNLTDHVGDFPKDKVLDILKEEVLKEFGFEPKIISTVDNILDSSTQIIVDRHNEAIRLLKLGERFPKQVSMLPLENELFNNERFFGKDMYGTKIIKEIRNAFEKKSD